MHEWFARQRISYGILVAMEPHSGRTIALVEYADDSDAKGMARRATYPAASVFKLVTTAAVLEKGVISPETVTRFRGEVLELNPFHWTEDTLLDDRQMTLTDALAESCIAVIARIALKWLKPEELYREAVLFGFNDEIGFELPVEVSPAPQPKDTSSLSYTATGFGDVGLSPIHGAMIAAMIANRGVMMAPRLIEQVMRDDEVVYTFQPQGMGQRMDAETAGQLSEMMVQTILRGTAKDAFRLWRRHPVLKTIPVGGKTGTLDGSNPPGEYSWFIGMAPVEKPQIAMAAMVIRQPYDRDVKAYDAAQYALKRYFIGSLHGRIKTTERGEHGIPVTVKNEQ
jgi:cell division protein FtsI/penicillin-binding protein 2